MRRSIRNTPSGAPAIASAQAPTRARRIELEIGEGRDQNGVEHGPV